MYDESWEIFRGDALEWAQRRDEDFLKKWLDDIGCKEETIGYFRDSYTKTMELYSRRPGVLIGKAGINIDKLEAMLTEEFHGDWKVKLVEVRGGFVTV